MLKSTDYPSCTSTANQWLPNHKDVQPMKIKDMNHGREDFCQCGKKKRSKKTPKKKYNPPGEQENMKMLTLNDFAEDLKDFVRECIVFSSSKARC